MNVVRAGDEVAVFDPDPETLAYLKTLQAQGPTLGKTRNWAERKPGFWRVSLSALAHLKASA